MQDLKIIFSVSEGELSNFLFQKHLHDVTYLDKRHKAIISEQ